MIYAFTTIHVRDVESKLKGGARPYQKLDKQKKN